MAKLMWIEAILSSAMILPAFVLFRERPPTAPSASAELPRDNFQVGLRKIMKDGNFLMLLCVGGFALGVLNALATVVQSLITPFGFTSVS